MKVIENNKECLVVEGKHGVEVILASEATPATVETGHTCDICYSPIEEGDEIVSGARHILAENEQKLGHNGIVHIECDADTKAEMELAHTDRYYDWTSATARMYDAVMDHDITVEEAREIGSKYIDTMTKLSHSTRDVVEEAEQNVAQAIEAQESRNGFSD